MVRKKHPEWVALQWGPECNGVYFSNAFCRTTYSFIVITTLNQLSEGTNGISDR